MTSVQRKDETVEATINAAVSRQLTDILARQLLINESAAPRRPARTLWAWKLRSRSSVPRCDRPRQIRRAAVARNSSRAAQLLSDHLNRTTHRVAKFQSESERGLKLSKGKKV
jgi:DNA-binding GntR family transcriptional regulator